MRSVNRPLSLALATSVFVVGAPGWAASVDANIEAFFTSSDFNLVSTDVQLRFTELAEAPGDNVSTHILIDGLVPVEEGSDVLTSSYRGIDIATGDVFDVGQVTLTLPAGASPSGASSPIVGIVARNTPSSGGSGWSAYTTDELGGTNLGGSTGTVDIDPAASGTMTFALTSGAGALTGTANYTVVDDMTIDVDAFSLTDPSGTHDFAAMQLLKWGESWYGVMMSESAMLPADYDSLMYTLRLGGGDDDIWGGYTVLTNPDGSRWADATSDWTGYINIDNDPFLFSFEMNVWMFMTEPASDANGSWTYAFKRGAQAAVSGWGGYNVLTNPDGSQWADSTGNWVGYLNIDNAPYLFSFEANCWMFMAEPADDAGGSWTYVFKR